MLVYLGVAAVAGATLLYEVALTRVFSIAYGYHFAFLAMSLGLLGFGASGTVLAVRRPPSTPLAPGTLGRLAVAAAVALVSGYAAANRSPFDPYRVGWEPGQLPLLAAYLLCYAVPFLLAGLALGLPLTRWPERAPRIYAADLAGSAVGAALALVALDRADPDVAVVVAGLVAALGALAFACAGSPGRRGPGRRGVDIGLGAGAAATAVLLVLTAPPWLD
ncbi:MAG: hypothetical protein ACRDKW_14405, partial [Actinomycetota bacterium]